VLHYKERERIVFMPTTGKEILHELLLRVVLRVVNSDTTENLSTVEYSHISKLLNIFGFLLRGRSTI
jgi:hypothetical protein